MEVWKKELKILAATFLVLVAVSQYRQYCISFRPDDWVWPFVVYLVYLGVSVGWTFKINRTVMNRNMRNFLMQEMAIMVFWMTIKMIQDGILDDPILIRKTGYLIVFPVVLIPLYGFFAVKTIGKGNETQFDWRYRLLYIPAVILIVLNITNDRHHIIFKMHDDPTDPLEFRPNYGFVILCIWVITFMALRIGMMIKRRSGDIRKIGSVSTWIIASLISLLIIYTSLSPYISPGFTLMEFTAMMFFGEGLIWENGVIGGAIAINSRYGRIFDSSTIAMQIVDTHGNVIKRSKSANTIDRATFEKLKEKGSLAPGRDIEYRIYPVNKGYVIWENEIKQVNDLIERFKSDEENLMNDVAIVEEELRISSGQVKEIEQNRILTDVTRDIKDEISLLKDLLKKTDDISTRDRTLRKINIVGTYIKRHCAVSIAERSEGKAEGRDIILFWSDMAKVMEQAGYTVDLNIVTERILDIKAHVRRLEELEKRMEETDFCPAVFRITVEGSDAEVVEYA